MEKSLVLSEKGHLDVGSYHEIESVEKAKKEQHMARKSLQQFDDEVEQEIQIFRAWSRKVSKDFGNPYQPTFKEVLTKCSQALEEILRFQPDLENYYKEEKTKGLLDKLFLVLNGLSQQIGMLLDLLNTDDTAELNEKILKKYEGLGELAIKLKDKSQICYKILKNCLSYLLTNLLLELNKVIQHLFNMKGVLSDETKGFEIQIMTAKIKVISEYLPIAANFNPADIFALDDDHPYLIELMKYVKIKVIGPPEQLQRSFKKFIRGIQVGVSTLSKGAEQNNIITRKLAVSFGAVYYYIWSSEAQMQTNLFYSQPIKEIAFNTWNTLEDELVANMMKVTLPYIQYANTIYINRMYEPINLSMLNESLQKNELNTLSSLNYPLKPKTHSDEVTTLAVRKSQGDPSHPYDVKINGGNKVPILVLNHKNLVIKKYTEIEILQKETKDHTVTTEVLSEKHIENSNVKRPETQKPRESYFCGLFDICQSFGCLGDSRDDEPPINGIIIHIHGGGFVSMSANSHQSYTRQWAKMLKMPVFSIDYRLAPQYPYPAALDDCWQAYNWIINYAEATLGTKLSRIVLTGDSAGGNLAISVTALAIKSGIRAPDGLLLAYPALNCDPNSFSPSLLLALDDQLVPYSLLKLCIQAYVPPEADPKKDPLISPTILADEILKKLPPVRIIVGDKDPLHDECWRFTDRLRNLGHDVLLTVYQNMCHGFLGYDVPMGMPESKVCIQDAAAMIGELLTGKKKTF